MSAGCYESLNLALHVGDDRERVIENRAIAVRRLALPADPVYVTQVHGTAVLRGEDAGESAPEGDALVSRKRGLPLAIMTADCLPVLFFDPVSCTIAAAHAGWRGLAAGVLEKTAGAMETDPGEIRAWLGPRIGSRVFEVGDEVRSAFLSSDSGAADAFRESRPGHWLCSLAGLARRRLEGLGLRPLHPKRSPALFLLPARRQNREGRSLYLDGSLLIPPAAGMVSGLLCLPICLPSALPPVFRPRGCKNLSSLLANASFCHHISLQKKKKGDRK